MTRPAHFVRNQKAFTEAQLTPAPIADMCVRWPAWGGKDLAVRPPWWRRAREKGVGNGCGPDGQQFASWATCLDHPETKGRV